MTAPRQITILALSGCMTSEFIPVEYRFAGAKTPVVVVGSLFKHGAVESYRVSEYATVVAV